MREAYSKLMKDIKKGKFVYTGELEPVKTTSLKEIITDAKKLKGHVIAINVTDNPTAFAYMNTLIPSYMIQKEVSVEAVYQMTVRDRNRVALLSDILAAGALDIKNILALSGDHISVGDTPQAKPVYDLDSATFVYMLNKILNEGVDLSGNEIKEPPKFNIGIAGNINADPLEPEILKIERKVRLGIDFIQTQAVYDIDLAKKFMKAIDYLNAPILIGLAPFRSVSMLDWMVKFVPGITVPKEIQERIKKADKKGGKPAVFEESVDIFGELAKELRKTTKAKGLHLMAFGFEEIVPRIIERTE